MRKPLVIEFTGTPNSGKTTLIKLLGNLLQSMGYKVEIKQEDAEIVPNCIPKKTWARNEWITLGQLQSLIEAKHSSSDIILLDRGFYDALFWADFLKIQNVCSEEESSTLVKYLSETVNQFHLKPDYLFAFDVSTEVSLKRRFAIESKDGNQTHIFSNTSFIDFYKQELEKFYEKVDVEMYRLDTTNLSLIQMQEIVLNEILKILENK